MNSKILILLTYYERPGLVRGFLRSLLRCDQYHNNWTLAFIDDGSMHKGRPIVERILGPKTSQVKFYDTKMSPEMKKMCGGTFIGRYMNQAIRESDADLAIMMGDDDEFCDDYFANLDRWFEEHPDQHSCYSNTYVFDPMRERAADTCWLFSDDPQWKGHDWFGKPINCSFRTDGIQVAWRIKCNKVHGVQFEYPIKINHDAKFFQELYDRCGPTPYSGFIGTYKGRHEGQLVKRLEGGGDMATGVRDKQRRMMI